MTPISPQLMGTERTRPLVRQRDAEKGCGDAVWDGMRAYGRESVTLLCHHMQNSVCISLYGHFWDVFLYYTLHLSPHITYIVRTLIRITFAFLCIYGQNSTKLTPLSFVSLLF